MKNPLTEGNMNDEEFDDGSWFSERTKTWIVSITMLILVGGMAWGYYTAYQWKAERAEQKLEQQQQQQQQQQ